MVSELVSEVSDRPNVGKPVIHPDKMVLDPSNPRPDCFGILCTHTPPKSDAQHGSVSGSITTPVILGSGKRQVSAGLAGCLLCILSWGN